MLGSRSAASRATVTAATTGDTTSRTANPA